MKRTVPLYERDTETAVLAALVNETKDGRGAIAAIEGNAGIGKTSLLDEAKHAAQLAGFRLACARGMEPERDFSFGIVRQLFEPLLAEAGQQGHREILSGAARQAEAVFGPVVPDTGRERDYAMLHGLLWLTANLCEDRPLALLIDDLHWADTPSLRFIIHLLPRIPDLAIATVVTLRPFEPGAEQHLLDRITTDPVCRRLHPQPLTKPAASALVRGEFAQSPRHNEPDEEFLAACHNATGGNPLLLQDLAAALILEHIPPTIANVPKVTALGPRAVAQWVTLWTRRLPPDATALAHAVAVLGDGAPLDHAAALADLTPPAATRACALLERIGMLRSGPAHPHRLAFVHPVVRAAVYDQMTAAQALTAHRHAVDLLIAASADVEKIAAHLLHLPPAGDAQFATPLRNAASQALARGSPRTAATYLRRCLAEPLTDEQRRHTLHELGRTLHLTDTHAAATYLRQALELSRDPQDRANIADLLGTGLLMLGQGPEALNVWSKALAHLPPDTTDLRDQLKAGILSIPILQPGWEDQRRTILPQLTQARSATSRPTLSGNLLDCVIAGHDALTASPHAVPRALRALNDGRLVTQNPLPLPVMFGWWALICADHPKAMDSLNTAIAHAHHDGSTSDLAAALTHRALAWLRQGHLPEAEADARHAILAADTAGIRLHQRITGWVLAEVLMEQGRLPEAQDALNWTDEADTLEAAWPTYHPLTSRAHLLRLQGRPHEALEAAHAAGIAFTTAGGHNPAIVAWQSEAALCLHLLSRDDEAQELSRDETRQAQAWGAPGALGRALRIAGLLHPGEQGTALLKQATLLLQPTPARLEYAKATAEYGASLRRAGARTEARRALTTALDAAEGCGAMLLARQIRSELKAGGGRPRRHALTGLDALTPSERRVAEIAADGKTNREIAQILFVTTKTVETHLASAYRKLGISDRRQLREKLAGDGHETARSGRGSSRVGRA